MVAELVNEAWTYEVDDENLASVGVEFASASSPDDGTLSVHVNDELVDKVYLQAPHSWWTLSGQPLVPGGQLLPGDTLRLEAAGTVAVRLDLRENTIT